MRAACIPFPWQSGLWLAALLIWIFMVWAHEVQGQDPLIRVEHQNRTLIGRSLVRNPQQLFLLGRDGRAWYLSQDEITSRATSSTPFSSYSSNQMRGRLSDEFGRGYEVSAAGQFVVVHPAGERSVWPRRFDELYRSFVHYFSTRGFRPGRPEFPLVAIVFPDRDEFLHYAQTQGDQISSQVVGYYSPVSNRIALYDQSGAGSDEADWERNASTIVHEAAHQSAFNLGIHNRFAPPPRWVTEGLGTMFEARGVWNSYRYPRQDDRVNQAQLQEYRRYLERDRQRGDLANFLNNDDWFDTEPAQAYSIAWALSFYLAETQAHHYIDYLQVTGQRESFSIYQSPDRQRDFTRIFGENLELLEARLIRYVEQLPVD